MRRIFAVSSLVILGLLVSCGQEDPQIETPAEKSLTEEAIMENNRGVGLMGSFDYDGAWQVFNALAEKYPGNSQLQVNRAIAQLNRQQEGDEQKALHILELVLESNPDHLNALYVAGVLQTNIGETYESHERFRVVAEQDPEDAYAAYFAGQTLLQMDRAKEALEWYERAISLDPYLRSAAYGAAQAARRLDRKEEAAVYLEQFQAMAENPRGRLAEIKYTRMGPRAEVKVLGEDAAVEMERPSGALWFPYSEIYERRVMGDTMPNVTACDINQDGQVEIFIVGMHSKEGGRSSWVYKYKQDDFVLDSRLPLCAVDDVNTVLWGDVDGNGWPDAYLCRDGGNQLWLQDNGQWRVELAIEFAEGMPRNTVDGAIFDADHDGDLDIYVANADGSNVLLNNNRDGTWRQVGSEEGLPTSDHASRQVVVADLDNDRDLDLVIINETPPNEVYLNDRLWRYEKAPGFLAFESMPMKAAIAGDIDSDGQVELISLSKDGEVHVWHKENEWLPRLIRSFSSADDSEVEGQSLLTLLDIDGSGNKTLLVSDSGMIVPVNPNSADQSSESSDSLFVNCLTMTPVIFEPGKGYSLFALTAAGPGKELERKILNPGAGRYPFVDVSFTGKHDEGQSMRSNASGIGTRYAARSGSRWHMGRVLRDDSGPGQNLQPIAIGLGPQPRLDFLAIEWSDGVYQTELGLSESTVIEETQRQLSSCPVLFVRDGDEQIFVSDLLGVGGIGFRTGRDTVVTPRPWERFLMPEGLLKSHDGRYELTIAEPMEESCYLDAARLVKWHLPPGWSMTLDERMGTGAPLPTGEPVFYRASLKPSRCRDNMSGEVTAELLEVDGVAAQPADHDVRFMGRLARNHQLELSFDQSLDLLPGTPVLVLDGWVEYPYSQTNFAAWQAGATYDPPTIEARGEDGAWEVVASKVGYPAGMPRQMSLPLASLPRGTDALRITSNLEIYWDAAMVVGSEPCPEALKQSLPLRSARLFDAGYPERRNGPQKRPGFDWSRRAPLWDTRFQRGMHSLHGNVHPLIEKTDSALAIFGPGEAVECSFSAIPDPLNLEPGWRTRFVLEIDGWCKDKDLFTQDGDTIEPLPVDLSGEAAMLHERHNNRWMGGH
ncbi:MAG: FG-GAP-like repeat-containing protein [Phycisphaerales bacterium]|nr:FG-GAP-like repeat-containing protein [Phycisphaerales bacterium]